MVRGVVCEAGAPATPVHVPEPFFLDVRPLGPHRVVIAVGGDLDLATVDAFQAALVTQHRTQTDVEVDLSALGFMDSTGISLLIRMQTEADRGGWGFVIRSELQHEIRRLFETMGMFDYLTFTPAAEMGQASGLGA